ncbi:MAG: hypothetical protein K6G04_01690 [Lachnospiraceae bacterium]|nr:hypothetical protein [Lachnospiraceae bacterium]
MPTELVRIQGTARGQGATHLTISLANYLASKERYRVGVVELRESGELARMLEGDMFVAEGRVGFCHLDVDYYPKATWEDVVALREAGYDYLLLLYPPACEGVEFPKECHRQLMIGSLKPWRYRDYQKFMRDTFLQEDIRKWDLCGLFLTAKEKKQFAEEFHETLRAVPYVENPNRLEKQDLKFLQSLLASWQ